MESRLSSLFLEAADVVANTNLFTSNWLAQKKTPKSGCRAMPGGFA